MEKQIRELVYHYGEIKIDVMWNEDDNDQEFTVSAKAPKTTVQAACGGGRYEPIGNGELLFTAVDFAHRKMLAES